MSMEIPQAVADLCARYCHELTIALPNTVVGVYLHGSVALGDFQQSSSDIDFITVVNRALTKQDVVKLKALHAQLAREFKRPPMEGVYLLPTQLGRSREEVPPIPAYHDGHFAMDRSGINPVTWYELRTHGVTLYGQEITTLDFEGSFERLREYSRVNVNRYWRPWVNAITKFPVRSLYALFSRNAVAWGVLGVTRLYHAIKEGTVVSKTGAGEYALQQMPEWKTIINEALRARKGMPGSEYTNPFARKRDMICYMNFIIDECNKMGSGLGYCK